MSLRNHMMVGQQRCGVVIVTVPDIRAAECARVRERIRQYGVEPQIVYGFNGEHLSCPYTFTDDAEFPRWQWTPGHLGCLTGHASALLAAKLCQWDGVIVFEDDAVIRANTLGQIESVCQGVPGDWHHVNFGPYEMDHPTKVDGGWRRSTKTCMAHAYAIRASAYDLILAGYQAGLVSVDWVPSGMRMLRSYTHDQLRVNQAAGWSLTTKRKMGAEDSRVVVDGS